MLENKLQIKNDIQNVPVLSAIINDTLHFIKHLLKFETDDWWQYKYHRWIICNTIMFWIELIDASTCVETLFDTLMLLVE